MEQHVINHPHNEASALIVIHNQAILDAMGWHEGFWTVSDEQPVEDAVAALGRSAKPGAGKGDNGAPASRWEVRPLKGKLGGGASTKKTTDCETLARAGAWIYVFGSHYGQKDGPLDPKRQFVARFNEALVKIDGRQLRATFDVARPAFHLHRLINDALAASELKLIGRGSSEREGLVNATLEDGKKRRKNWSGQLRPEDYPINIEGSTFLPSGRLLLGLRYPVTSDGHPILIEVDGIDRVFEDDDDAQPQITRVWAVANIGSKRAPQGVRELDQRGSVIHLITGDLDSQPDTSLILEDHPEGASACCEHHTVEMPTPPTPLVRAKRVRRFDDHATIEGLAVDDDGTVWYVHDDEQIRLEVARPRAGKRPE